MTTYQGLMNNLPNMTVGARVTKVSQGYTFTTKEVDKVSASKPRVFPSEWKAVVPTA